MPPKKNKVVVTDNKDLRMKTVADWRHWMEAKMEGTAERTVEGTAEGNAELLSGETVLCEIISCR